MVLTANDLSEWKDFPKGLKVLLLNHDNDSAAETKSKLESMDYIVFTFYNEDEALSAFSNKPESFHIAIVEVNAGNEKGSFKFLETTKDLPVIMTSDIQCLSTMMKCIALGAVEFLQKPLSEEKMRNIWQHVVHKAFNAKEKCPSESLRPVIDLKKAEDASVGHGNDSEESPRSDKYPAPATPQLNDGDCRDNNTNSSIEGESTKSVETTCGNSVAETVVPIDETQTVKKEDELGDGSNSDNSIRSNHKDSKTAEKRKAASDPHDGKKANRKKIKVDWTPGLHKKFVQAVEQLGVDQAIPSLILELMKVEGLTRHNVASHLQKYRMHRRHILPKEDRKWLLKDHHQAPRGCYQHKPIMPFPPLPPSQMYPMWGAPPHPVWGPPSYPSWQPAEPWHWKPYPAMHADAWGCPVMPPPPPQGLYPPMPQNVNHCFDTGILQSCADFQLDEEEIDKVVKEVVNKPWLPLPLGLKPPSTESVLAELSRQGICTIPPHAEGAYSY